MNHRDTKGGTPIEQMNVVEEKVVDHVIPVAVRNILLVWYLEADS